MNLLSATHEIFSDLNKFLQQIDEGAYSSPLEFLSGSTIGQHTRHAIEFFECLLSQSGSGVINYDKRRRNHLMETDKAFALQVLDQLVSDFSAIDSNKQVALETTLSTSEDDYSLVPSSFNREWSYVLEHAIHHMAIIRMALKTIAPEVKVPDNFGVGPATVKHRQRQCAP